LTEIEIFRKVDRRKEYENIEKKGCAIIDRNMRKERLEIENEVPPLHPTN